MQCISTNIIMLVLSKSVADAFAYFGDVSTTETEKFVRNFDRLFDCLNVRSLSEWKTRSKALMTVGYTFIQIINKL